MSHRDKIKLLKHEKMKYENLQEQHKWKLETHLKKYPKALKAQLNKERQILLKSFIYENVNWQKMKTDKTKQNSVLYQIGNSD